MSGGPFIKRPLRAKLKTPSLAKARHLDWHRSFLSRALTITNTRATAPKSAPSESEAAG